MFLSLLGKLKLKIKPLMHLHVGFSAEVLDFLLWRSEEELRIYIDEETAAWLSRWLKNI